MIAPLAANDPRKVKFILTVIKKLIEGRLERRIRTRNFVSECRRYEFYDGEALNTIDYLIEKGLLQSISSFYYCGFIANKDLIEAVLVTLEEENG